MSKPTTALAAAILTAGLTAILLARWHIDPADAPPRFATTTKRPDVSESVRYPLGEPVTPPPNDSPEDEQSRPEDPVAERIRAGHDAVRQANRQEIVEDYVEAIDGMVCDQGEARVRDLARCFGVSHVTVVSAVERLRREGLVGSGQQQAIELTDAGRELAARSRERHAAILRFFLAFGLSTSVAASDAEGVEHHVSEETLDAFARYVDAHRDELATAEAQHAAESLVRPTDPSRFARVRAAHSTELIEDYVEAIDDMIRGRGEARIGVLAKRFGVAQVTATRRVSRLRRLGYVTTKPRMPLELSKSGRELAEACRARHTVVLRFLLALGVPRPSAEIDAEGVEHHVSPETLRRFAAFADSR